MRAVVTDARRLIELIRRQRQLPKSIASPMRFDSFALRVQRLGRSVSGRQRTLNSACKRTASSSRSSAPRATN